MKLKPIAALLMAACMTFSAWGVPAFADETSDAASEEGVTLLQTPVADAVALEAKEKADYEEMINQFCQAYLEEQAEIEAKGELSLAGNADEGDILHDGDYITTDGTYYVTPDSYGIVHVDYGVQDVNIEGSGFVIQTGSKAEVHPAQMTFVCDGPDVHFIMNNVALSMSCEYDYPDFTPSRGSQPARGNNPNRSVIRFERGYNILEFNGVNLIERNYYDRTEYAHAAAIAINDIERCEGTMLTFTTEDPNDRGKLYFYTRASGTGIGGDGDYYRDPNSDFDTEIYYEKYANAPIIFDGPDIFAKGTKSGNMIGAPCGANTGSNKVTQGNIAVRSGSLNLIINSGGTCLGGSTASEAFSVVEDKTLSTAGILFMEGGTLNVNMDWAGPAFKSTGSYRNAANDPLINGSVGAGYVLYSGGSMRIYKDMNAAGKWTAGGNAAKGYGVDFCGIQGNVKNNRDGDGDQIYLPETTLIEASDISDLDNMYFLNFNTNVFPGAHNSNQTYSISTGGVEIIDEGKPAEYYFINENYYKSEQTSITTTYTNWSSFDNVLQSRRDSNLYLPVVPKYDSAGDGYYAEIEVTSNNVTQNYTYTFHPVGGTSALPDQCLSYFTLNHEGEIAVTGGDTIDTGGYYVITDGTPGSITINTTDVVTLRTAGQNEAQTSAAIKYGSTQTVCLAAAAGVIPNLVFEGVEMNYSNGSVLNFPAGANIELVKTENAIHGLSTTAGNPAVSVGTGTLTITGDSQYYGYSTADTLTIDATTNNASLYLGTGASYVQTGATVLIEKKNGISGNAKGAVSAQNATVNIQKGDFYVGTAGTSVPAIYTGTLTTTAYSKITACAAGNTYALMCGSYNMAGSIKLTAASSAVNEAAAYDLTEGSCFSEMRTGKKCYMIQTGDLPKTGGNDATNASYFILWEGGNVNPSDRIYVGAIHELKYDTSYGWHNVSSGNVLNASDKNLYMWFDNANQSGSLSHSIYANDGCVGTINWNSTNNTWSLMLPSYITSVVSTPKENDYPTAGAVTITSDTRVSQGDYITGRITTNLGYALKDFRYYYTAPSGSEESVSILDCFDFTTGTFNVQVNCNMQLEAIWEPGYNAQCEIDFDVDGVIVTGLSDLTSGALQGASSGTGPAIREVNVTSSRPCMIFVNGNQINAVNVSGNQYRFNVPLSVGMTLVMGYKGDADGNGIIDVQDASAVINSLRTLSPLTGNGALFAKTRGADTTLSLTDCLNILNQIYNKNNMTW